MSQEEEGTQAAALGPGTLRELGSGGWAGGLATWEGNSVELEAQGEVRRKQGAIPKGRGGNKGQGPSQRKGGEGQ